MYFKILEELNKEIKFQTTFEIHNNDFTHHKFDILYIPKYDTCYDVYSIDNSFIITKNGKTINTITVRMGKWNVFNSRFTLDISELDEDLYIAQHEPPFDNIRPFIFIKGE